MRRLAATWGFGMAMLFLGAAPPAQSEETAPDPARAPEVRVYIDPATGKPVATPAPGQAEALEALDPQPARRSAGEPIVELLPDGSEMIRLDESRLNKVEVRKTSDGALVSDCTTGHAR